MGSRSLKLQARYCDITHIKTYSGVIKGQTMGLLTINILERNIL